MKVWLVTGGYGFIGSHLCRKIIREGLGFVVNVDAVTYAANPENVTDLVGLGLMVNVEADIRDAGLIAGIMASVKPDYVCHLAAESHVDNAINGHKVFMETNVIGTYNVLEAARLVGVERFMNMETDEVYGSVAQGYFTEESPLIPSSVYSASKASAGCLGRAYVTTYGLPVIGLRPTNNFGTHQHPEKLIPRFITTLLDGGSVPVYGTGKNVRTWLWVEDCCDAIVLATIEGKPGEVYNVSSSVELTNLFVTMLLLQHLGLDESRIKYVQDRLGHDFRYAVDSQKIRRELGWVPTCDNVGAFDKKLGEIVDWYRKKAQL